MIDGWKLQRDPDGKPGNRDIMHRCSPKAVVGGWVKLGTIVRWNEGAGWRYQWQDLAGVRSGEAYRTRPACLGSFVAEMERRGNH